MWLDYLSPCSHDAVFYGNTNLMHNGKVVGVVDIWKCRSCHDLFVDEKRFVDEKTSTDVGLKDAGEGAKWGVLICTSGVEVSWSIQAVKPQTSLEHKCLYLGTSEITVNDYWSTIGSDKEISHRILLVEDYVNKIVDISDIVSI